MAGPDYAAQARVAVREEPDVVTFMAEARCWLAFKMTLLGIQRLEVFWAIMNTGSVTTAARSMNVTQPSVS